MKCNDIVNKEFPLCFPSFKSVDRKYAFKEPQPPITTKMSLWSIFDISLYIFFQAHIQEVFLECVIKVKLHASYIKHFKEKDRITIVTFP